MAKFGVKEVADVTFYDVESNEPVVIFESLKMSNLENNAETTYAQGGKGNARLIGWDFNRTATFNMQDALIDTNSLGLIAGNTPVKGATEIHAKEVHTVAAGKITVNNTPTGTVTVFNYAGGSLGTKLEATNVDTAVTVTGAADGDVVIAFYTYESDAEAEVVTITADNFPGFYKVVGDTVVRNSNGVDEPFQIVIPKVKVLPGFTFTMEAEGDPSVFDFACEVMKDDATGQMVKLIKY